MRPEHAAEVDEIVGVLAAHSARPDAMDTLAFEACALRVWRLRRHYADLSERGVFRDGEPARGLESLDRLEGRLQTDFRELGLTPRGRAELGLTTIRAKGEALREHLEEHYARDESEGQSS